MMEWPDIRKLSGRTLIAIAALALLVGFTNTASAGKKEDDLSKGYCDKISLGNRFAKASCTEDEKKAKARLEKLDIDPHTEGYCKRWAGDGYVEYEKCVSKIGKEIEKRKRRTKR